MKRLLCLTACLFSLSAQAAPFTAPHTAPLSSAKPSVQSCAISAAQAGKIARQTFGGKVIDIKAAQYKGRSVFRVKLLQKNGRIHSVLIDANSGQPLK